MSGRSLKNYDLYLQKIEAYAEASGIKILRKLTPFEGVFSPSKRTITIDSDLEESTEIAVFLHELGHAIDDYLINSENHQISDAYRAYECKLHTSKHSKTIVECEQRAWDNGRNIAKLLKIRLGAWYSQEENLSLQSYREDTRDSQNS